MNTAPPARIVWIDLETTGLNARTDLILEVAAVVTDTSPDLREIARFHCVVAHHPDAIASRVDDYVRHMHTANGLLAQIAAGPVPDRVVYELDAAHRLADFIREHTVPGQAPLGGSSPHFDRAALVARWPAVVRLLHHRNVDVSTLRTLTRAWAPQHARGEASDHRALDDVLWTINELRGYQRLLWSALDEAVPA